MNDEAPREPQRAPGKSSWLFTAVCCVYFLWGGLAAYKVVPICLTYFAGLGMSFSTDSLLFHFILNYEWLIVAGVAFLVILVLAKQIGNFSERYRRPVNLVLLIAAIGFAPQLLVAFTLALLGPFQLLGKLAQ